MWQAFSTAARRPMACIELGKRKISAEKLLILARYYHVSMDYMMGLTDKT